jgi:hypothetical protein
MRFPLITGRAAAVLAIGIAITLPGIAVASAHTAASSPGAASSGRTAAPEAYGTWDYGKRQA